MADYPPTSYRFPVSESDFLGFPFLPFRSDFFARFPKNGGALIQGRVVYVETHVVWLEPFAAAVHGRWGCCEDKIRLLGFTRYTASTLRSSAMLGPSHPDTKVRCSYLSISIASAKRARHTARLIIQSQSLFRSLALHAAAARHTAVAVPPILVLATCRCCIYSGDPPTRDVDCHDATATDECGNAGTSIQPRGQPAVAANNDVRPSA